MLLRTTHLCFPFSVSLFPEPLFSWCAVQHQSRLHFKKILQHEQKKMWFWATMKSVLCLCMCDVLFSHGTDTPRCNRHTWRICHLYHVGETLEWLWCRLRNQKWSEWRTWPWSATVHQSAKCEASFLCFRSTDFSLFFLPSNAPHCLLSHLKPNVITGYHWISAVDAGNTQSFFLLKGSFSLLLCSPPLQALGFWL